MPEPHLRAADSDRAAVAAVLGEHMAAGRLTLAEYDERVARAYASRTYGELEQLTADLPRLPEKKPAEPAPTTSATPAPAASSSAPGPWAWHGASPWHDAAGRRAAWGSWLATSIIVIVIWAVTSLGSGDLLYFWPMWVIGPWGAVLLAQTLTSGREDRRDDGPGQLRA